MNFPTVFPKAPDELIAQRLATCRACEHRGELPIVRTEVCKLCGCPIVNKTKFQQSTCPQGQW